MDRLNSVVRYWLQRDPVASWRRFIWRLDVYSTANHWEELRTVAGIIINYAEKLTGPAVLYRLSPSAVSDARIVQS